MTDRGMLIVFFEPPATLEEEFHDWYDTEHLPERARIAGFESARRFVSLGDGPRYAAVYDLTRLDVLEGEEYRAVAGANFSPWTRRIMSRARSMRLTGQEVASAGDVPDRFARLVVMRFWLAQGADLRQAAPPIAAACAGLPGVARARLFEGVEPEPGYVLLLAETDGSASPAVDLGSIGAASARCDLSTTYRPYRL